MRYLTAATRLAIAVCGLAGAYLLTVPQYAFEKLAVDPVIPGLAPELIQPPVVSDQGTVTFWADGPYRIRAGQAKPAFEPSEHLDTKTHCMAGEKCYYAVGSRGAFGSTLTAFQDGRAEKILSPGDPALNGKKFRGFDHLTSRGNQIVFCSELDFGSGAGIFAYQDGALTTVLGGTKPLKSHEIQHVVAEDDRVVVLMGNAVVSATNDTATDVVSVGETVGDQKIFRFHSMSAQGGNVAVVADLRNEKVWNTSLLFISNGQLKVLSNHIAASRWICTNGDAVAFVESPRQSVIPHGMVFVGGAAEFWKKFPKGSKGTLFVHDNHGRSTVCQTGDSLFDEILDRIFVGPRGIDPAGNIVFRYRLANDENGFAMAKKINASNAAWIFFGLAATGIVFDIWRYIRSRNQVVVPNISAPPSGFNAGG